MLIYRHLAVMVYSEKMLKIIALMKCEDHHTNKSAAGMQPTPPRDIFTAKKVSKGAKITNHFETRPFHAKLKIGKEMPKIDSEKNNL